MADFGELDTAPHIGNEFREAFPTWGDFRNHVGAIARYPEFNENRALQQVLMSDLASRLTSSNDHDWLLIGSLALPARVPADLPWPDSLPSPVSDIDPAYVMPRSAFDLDLCAVDITDSDPAVAADRYRDEVLAAVRGVTSSSEATTDGRHGVGLGGLVRYSTDDLRVFPNGQVMGIVNAQPVDPRFGPRNTPAVDDPIPIEIDIKPPSKVTVTGGPDASQRPITGFPVPGFDPYQPPLNPIVNQLADKAVLLTGKPHGLRDLPTGPWHRYKDVFDTHFMITTCRIDADTMREAVKNNWNLDRMGMESVPRPYRFYGQDNSGPEPAVPWKQGTDGLRTGSPQLQQYPSWEGMRGTVSEFMDSLPHAPSGSTWVPGRGWSVEHSATQQHSDARMTARERAAAAANATSTTVSRGPDKPSSDSSPEAPRQRHNPDRDQRRDRGRS